MVSRSSLATTSTGHPCTRSRSSSSPGSPPGEGRAPLWPAWTVRSRSSPAAPEGSDWRSAAGSPPAGARWASATPLWPDHPTATARVLDQHAPLDILVNNAGITIDRTVRKMSVEDWDRVIHVNLSGAFYL